MALTGLTRLKILWRANFVQSAWNFKGMQNIGFSFMLAPGLSELAAAPERLNDYGRFFNTQPYMAPIIAGVDLNLEAAGQAATADKLQRSLASSLAAIGDTLFWGTLKPLMGLAAVLSAILGSFWGIGLSLLAFNLVRGAVVCWGFDQGLKLGPQGALNVSSRLSVNRTGSLTYFISLLGGLTLMQALPNSSLNASLMLAIFLASLVAARLKISIFKVFYGVLALILLWTVLA
ncbi:MAG: Mannose permease IID component [Deltaproteobacteria bacterium ADurb.Bin510]|nr:MAG: Mannose permease IID component [Deltaproteobacteria bacterium ADurb.Bin510]